MIIQIFILNCKLSKIESFLLSWESDVNIKKFAFYNVALTRHLLSLIGDAPNTKIRTNRINSFYERIKYLFWIACWSFKWLFFSMGTSHRILLAALGSNRKITYLYLSEILKILNSQDIIVTLNVPLFAKLLLNRRIFYFPRFLYPTRDFDIHVFNKLYNSLRSLIPLNKLEMNNKRLEKIFKKYSYDEYRFELLINKLDKSCLLGLIQDFDNSTNKVLYYKIANANKIKTIVIDHSIQKKTLYLEKKFSDYSLFFGQSNARRSLIVNKKNTKSYIVGHPQIAWQNIQRSGRHILLILEAYSEPSNPNNNRNLGLLNAYINKLCLISKMLGLKFVIKPHPEDVVFFKKKYMREKFKIISKLSKRRIENTLVILMEDSTTLIDYSFYNIPIIYLANITEEDEWELKLDSNIHFCQNPNSLPNIFNKQDLLIIDMEKRLKFVNKYIAIDKNFTDQLHYFFNKHIL